MANTSAPFGFDQRSGTGSAPTYEQIAALVQYNAAAIFFGDPVAWASPANGTIIKAPSSSAGPDQIVGIFVGCKYLSVSQKRTVWSNYWPGSDVASGNYVEGYIVNDPNAKFVAQTDATGLSISAIGQTVGFTAGAGNTANGISTAFIDSTTLGVANEPFKVVDLIVAPPGSQGTLQNGQPYNYAVVQFNDQWTRAVN
jgi:hypothetical protein